MTRGIYEQLGTRPVINALGIYTDLGGSVLAPDVWSAMTEANRDFADLPELLATTGEMIANLMGAEAARVTPGASAAIVLACGAAMTGSDGASMEQLPETTGLRGEIVIQAGHRYKYDRMIRMSGARLVEAGDRRTGTSHADLRAALGPATAAVFVPGHLDGAAGTVPLGEVIAIAHEFSLPVIVDAAYLNYPVDLMRSFTGRGADLAIFSAKYFGGPNAGGLVCGSRELVDAIAGIDFTRFESGEHLILGRPFKLDRQLVVGVVLALHHWLTADHGERFRHYTRLVDVIAGYLQDVPGVQTTPMSFTMAEELIAEPVNCLLVSLGSADRASRIGTRLRAGNPAIYAHVRDDALIVDVEVVSDEQASIIGARLREEIAADTEQPQPAAAAGSVLPGDRGSA
jgi:D-glucosaminate-6-phosphate ammonia-lyase